MAKLLDANGRVMNEPPPRNSPDREMLRILRIVEQAKRIGMAELCAQLQECFTAGWSLTQSDDLAPDKVEITIISHLDRDANGKLRHRPERWIRMGAAYREALAIMKAENGK